MEQSIFLYRDPFGVKPLYYTFLSDETLVFASERKALFCYPGTFPRLDKKGLCEIFAIGPSKTPGCGVFKGINEIKPGYYLRYDRFGQSTICYFRIKSMPHTDDYETTIEKTADLLKNAIKRQIVSDVPICTFLSGGIDSSIVSAVCANELKERGQVLDTYSFDFTDNARYFKSNAFQPEQDRPYVDQMVSYLGTSHHYLTCNMEELADLLYDSVLSRDQPTMADVDSSLLYFCKMVSEHNKVVLTGECADEIFGGYPWFYREDLLASDTFPWMIDLTPRKQLLDPEFADTLQMDDYVKNLYHQIISEIPVLPEESDIEKSRRQIGYMNIRMFMQTLLDRKDRMSMYSGLEVRVPFCDYRIAEYLYSVPWEYKDYRNQEKGLLREAMRGVLPDEVLWRRKSPYPKTWNPSYLAAVTAELRGVLADPAAPILRVIKADALENLLASGMDNPIPWYGQLMTTPQTIAWFVQLNYWLEKYKVELV